MNIGAHSRLHDRFHIAAGVMVGNGYQVQPFLFRLP
jgi:hypothetical protein